ncbi:MAG: AtpZ/AtpI family protein [Hymenobacteraceae bacterium]|nr:AtpZ/AtpI family protein [Hymenobacteraceae bacterium]
MESNPDPNKPEQQRQENIKPYVKYSGMAFQMIGALVVAAFVGMKLDDFTGNEKPWFTIALLLIAVVASMVLTIVSISKK